MMICWPDEVWTATGTRAVVWAGAATCTGTGTCWYTVCPFGPDTGTSAICCTVCVGICMICGAAVAAPATMACCPFGSVMICCAAAAACGAAAAAVGAAALRVAACNPAGWA